MHALTHWWEDKSLMIKTRTLKGAIDLAKHMKSYMINQSHTVRIEKKLSGGKKKKTKPKNNLFQSNLTAVKTPSASPFPIAGSKLSEHTASSVVGGL